MPLWKSLFQVSNLSSCCERWAPMIMQVRSSRYNPTYLEPTPNKEDLSKPLDEEDPRHFQPIKAALNEDTSSQHFDPLVVKFTRLLLKEGNKDLARYIVDRTFEHIKYIQLGKYHRAETEFERNSVELNPRAILHQAVDNCKPVLITQQVRRGGVSYQVPIPVTPHKQTFKAMRWLIESGKEKSRSVRVWEKMAFELLEASRNEGRSVRKKQDLHRLCEANRAYAHFRWGK